MKNYQMSLSKIIYFSDIIYYLSFFLDINSLLALRVVSKELYNQLSNPTLWRIRYKQDFGEVNFPFNFTFSQGRKMSLTSLWEYIRRYTETRVTYGSQHFLAYPICLERLIKTGNLSHLQELFFDKFLKMKNARKARYSSLIQVLARTPWRNEFLKSLGLNSRRPEKTGLNNIIKNYAQGLGDIKEYLQLQEYLLKSCFIAFDWKLINTGFLLGYLPTQPKSIQLKEILFQVSDNHLYIIKRFAHENGYYNLWRDINIPIGEDSFFQFAMKAREPPIFNLQGIKKIYYALEDKEKIYFGYLILARLREKFNHQIFCWFFNTYPNIEIRSSLDIWIDYYDIIAVAFLYPRSGYKTYFTHPFLQKLDKKEIKDIFPSFCLEAKC